MSYKKLKSLNLTQTRQFSWYLCFPRGPGEASLWPNETSRELARKGIFGMLYPFEKWGNCVLGHFSLPILQVAQAPARVGR